MNNAFSSVELRTNFESKKRIQPLTKTAVNQCQGKEKGTSKMKTQTVKKTRLKSPKTLSVAATRNDSVRLVLVTIFICSILSKSPPIAEGRKIDPYADKTYPLVASTTERFAIGLKARLDRRPPKNGRRTETITMARNVPMLRDDAR